jgi:hypothetical protein
MAWLGQNDSLHFAQANSTELRSYVYGSNLINLQMSIFWFICCILLEVLISVSEGTYTEDGGNGFLWNTG